jgi:hypothetical protein
MHRAPAIFLCALVSATPLAGASSAPAVDRHASLASPTSPGTRTGNMAAARYGELPLCFEPNLGQATEDVSHVARAPGYSVLLSPAAVVLALGGRHPVGEDDRGPRTGKTLPARGGFGQAGGEAVRLSFVGANTDTRPAEEGPLASRSNYLRGPAVSNWVTDVPHYAAVRYTGLYDGIDAVFYGGGQRLEYDFEVAPGADPSRVRVRFEGQEAAEVTEAGELILKLKGGEVRQPPPVAYQDGASGKRQIGARYALGAGGEVGFALEDYDRARPLVIDPVLIVAVDAAGAAYITGYTDSKDFPTTPGSYDAGYNGGHTDAFVTKLSPDGGAIVYSTFVGGTGDESGEDIAVDASGAAYVTGFTVTPMTGSPPSSDFPVTPGAFDANFNGGDDAFVAKLSADGSALVYSTFLGGTGEETGLAFASTRPAPHT